MVVRKRTGYRRRTRRLSTRRMPQPAQVRTILQRCDDGDNRDGQGPLLLGFGSVWLLERVSLKCGSAEVRLPSANNGDVILVGSPCSP